MAAQMELCDRNTVGASPMLHAVRVDDLMLIVMDRRSAYAADLQAGDPK